VDRRTHGSNESWVEWTQRNRTDLSGAPEMLATYIKNFGDEGIVQARDFVEQWDQAKPGQGSDAIRQILALVADPSQRERFLGGRLPNMPPFGVLKPDAEQRIAALTGGATSNIVAEKTEDDPELVYDPILNTYVWKQPKFELRPYANAVGDDPARPPAPNGIVESDADNGGATGSDEADETEDPQEAQQRNTRRVDDYFERMDQPVRELAGRLGIEPAYLHSVFAYESGWLAGTSPEKNNPMGYTGKDGVQSFDSIEDALKKWENKWGPVVKDSKSIDEFIDRLQVQGDERGNRYNSVASRRGGTPNANGKYYEDVLKDMDRTIRSRQEIWRATRKPAA